MDISHHPARVQRRFQGEIDPPGGFGYPSHMQALWTLPSMREPRMLLERALASRRLPPTWLLAGPEGTGTWALGMALAQALLCTQPTPWGCGKCASCQRVLSFSHSDLLVLFPFPTGGGSGKAKTNFQQEYAEALFEAKRANPLNSVSDLPNFELRNRYIPVERATELLNWASLKPSEGAHKVAFIFEPELFASTVTDKLLKLTEEPPADTSLILVSHRQDLLPPTIRSRARLVRTLRSGPRQLEAFLVKEGHAAPAAAAAARSSRGLVEYALGLIEREAEGNREEEALGLLSGLLANNGAALTALNDWQWKGARERVGAYLDVWALLIRDVSCSQVSGAVLATPPGELAGRLSGLADPRRAEKALAEIRRTQRALGTHVHLGVAISALSSKLGQWGLGAEPVAPLWKDSQFV